MQERYREAMEMQEILIRAYGRKGVDVSVTTASQQILRIRQSCDRRCDYTVNLHN